MDVVNWFKVIDWLIHWFQANPHTIDGIVLTKFDTIDDKVENIIMFLQGCEKSPPPGEDYQFGLRRISSLTEGKVKVCVEKS